MTSLTYEITWSKNQWRESRIVTDDLTSRKKYSIWNDHGALEVGKI